jgi:hypothetical protein
MFERAKNTLLGMFSSQANTQQQSSTGGKRRGTRYSKKKPSSYKKPPSIQGVSSTQLQNKLQTQLQQMALTQAISGGYKSSTRSKKNKPKKGGKLFSNKSSYKNRSSFFKKPSAKTQRKY